MAGFFGIGDFTKDGPGVKKDVPQKRGVFLFIELFFRKFFKMSRLNVLYAIAALPTFIVAFIVSGVVTQNIISLSMGANPQFAQNAELLDLVLRFFVSLIMMIFWGMGPVTAGFTYILRNYAREEHAWLWSDFGQHTKQNFKQAIVVWLVDQLVFILLCTAYVFYNTQASLLFFVKYIIIWIAILYTIMHFYIYPIMVTFKMKLKDIYRNALLLSVAKLPVNIFILFILLLINVGIPYAIMTYAANSSLVFWAVFLVLEFVILISLSGFITTFGAYQSIKKHMISEEEGSKTEEI